MKHDRFALLVSLAFFAASSLRADPCGMVPPIHIAGVVPITRIGLQKTYVFYKDGVETFVIRPGFSGQVDNFGMLVPLPSVPAIRKVPDEIFSHIAAAVDPPEVVVNLFPRVLNFALAGRAGSVTTKAKERGLAFDAVRVVRQEAIGMYEVAVLEAGSPAALKRWMDDHGYKYPNGMDRACEDYVASGWCFVAVKTRVGQKAAVNPRPGLRDVNPDLPTGATFDGHVQAMGFRFRADEFVVPMRLSTFNEGELRNVVYILTDEPQKIDHIPEEYVVRQIPGEELYKNLTRPLPLRVLGGTYEDIPAARLKGLEAQRDPKPHNGLARSLFAGDLMAVSTGQLSHAFEEDEKELLRISERLGLRGPEIDALHREALAASREKTLSRGLEDLKRMTLTVVDGDFPREVLSRENLTFSRYAMAGKKNEPRSYEAKSFGPTPEPSGKLYRSGVGGSLPSLYLWIALCALLFGFVVACVRRRTAVSHRVGLGKASGILMAGWLAGMLYTDPAVFAADDVVEGLIDRLDNPQQSEAAVEALIALGDEAIPPLFDEAIDGHNIARRGWAIACLAEIGGDKVDRRLVAIQRDERQSKLVRSWAGAARVQLAKTSGDLAALAKSVPELPALGRPIGKRLAAVFAGDNSASVNDLIRLGLDVPELQAALASPILAGGAESLVQAMVTGQGAVRRQAAAYLATLAGQGETTRVATATVAAYRYQVAAISVPWRGGPLFVPSIAWPKKEARDLAESLVKWLLFSERSELVREKRQLHNNLRSLKLATAAGYVSPGFRQAGIDEWLTAWGRAFGRENVKELLEEQGVARDERYVRVLEGL